MNDTHPEILKLFKEMMLQKSGEERLIMGCSMFDTEKELVKSSILEKYPQATPELLRREIFLRFYWNEFTQKEKEKIIDFLTKRTECFPVY